ncbi:hypothetical protein TrLO_g1137 [Triparma laevis f. longispina]|uniref:Uncharacterized protein n=1 Tax=Triparma laevis f. longispina TaxID=1714387 RepID=A0A9W7F4Q6_9STRA|nr:hypothetical protein TrLO_g1137 [Triparma laevis f. longispina]
MECTDHLAQANAVNNSIKTTFPEMIPYLYQDVSVRCNATWFTAESNDDMWQRHPIKWSVSNTALFVTQHGIGLGLNGATNPKLGRVFYDNDVDGKLFVKLTVKDLVEYLGLTLGSAERLVEARNTWLGSYAWPPSDYEHPTTGERTVGEQFDLSISLVLERILVLNEADFSFELEIFVFISWEDPKVFARCVNAGIGGYAEDDPCGLFWKPELVWDNLVMDDGDSKLVPYVIEDMGYSTAVGQKNQHNVVGDTASKALNTSVASHMYRVRGKFFCDFSFENFPHDQQQLNVSVTLPHDLSMRKAKLISQAVPFSGTTIEGGGDLPLWKTSCVSSSIGVKSYTPVANSILASPIDPYALYWQKVYMMSPEDFAAELFQGDTEANMESYQQWSTLTFSVTVDRIPTFYMANFVLVLTLLVVVSFFSLILDKAKLDSRLSLTLTVILGLNVYQIVIIDNMPATGYLTRMHTFCLNSTLIVVSVALENLLVYIANKRVIRIAMVAEKFKVGGVFGGIGGGGGEDAGVTKAKGLFNRARGKKIAVEEGNAGESTTATSTPTSTPMSLDMAAQFIDKRLDSISVFMFPCVFAINYLMLFAEAGNDRFVCPD